MKKSFESQIENLEKIVAELENGELSLDESVSKFEEGIKISKECNKTLEEAEKKITILINNDGETKEEEFKINKIVSNITTIGTRNNIYSTSLGLIKYFAYKEKSRNIDYLMFDLEDKESLTSKKKKVSTMDNLINKIEAYLKG